MNGCPSQGMIHMKEKKWVDCPSCGSKGTMKRREGVAKTFRHADYAPIRIRGLDGYFCASCGDGIYSPRSTARINSVLAEEMAKRDSSRVPASDLLEVDQVVRRLAVSRQRVHKMMDEGKLHYVYVGALRFPTVRNDFSLLKKRIHATRKQKKAPARDRG